MNRFCKFVSLAMAVVFCAVGMSACKVTLHSDEGGLHDKRHDIHYHMASTVYEAVSLRKDYGKFNVTSKESYKLYTLPDTDPEDFLATEDGDILFADGIEMPSLMQMEPTVLRICVDDVKVREVATIADSTILVGLVLEYETNDNLTPPVGGPAKFYTVRFQSNLYPGFYYKLTYLEYAEDYIVEKDGESHNYGKYFLQSAFDSRFIPVGDQIHTALNDQSGPVNTETVPETTAP